MPPSVAVTVIDTACLPPLWHPGSLCSGHMNLSTLAKTYQASFHMTFAPATPFAWSTGPQLSAWLASHRSSYSYAGTSSKKTSQVPLHQVPHRSHSIISSLYFLHRLLSPCYSFVCTPFAWLPPSEDKLQEVKSHLSCSPAFLLIQYLVRNMHLINTSWTGKQKA